MMFDMPLTKEQQAEQRKQQPGSGQHMQDTGQQQKRTGLSLEQRASQDSSSPAAALLSLSTAAGAATKPGVAQILARKRSIQQQRPALCQNSQHCHAFAIFGMLSRS